MTSASTLLRKLESTRVDYGPGRASTKKLLLRTLEKKKLPTPSEVLRLHEHLCFLRAYPDNRLLDAQVNRMLKVFAARADLRRHRAALADTGVAGTVIHYRFFWPTARWLAARWPEFLEIDWENVEDEERLAGALPLLITPLEANWLKLRRPEPRRSLACLRGAHVSDGTFFVRRVEVMPGDHVTREAFFDGLDTPFLLRPGSATPSRTHARYRPAASVFRRQPPQHNLPDLLGEISRPPRSVRTVSVNEGQELIDLAQGAMVTRERDLDNFAYGDPHDVRIIDDGAGLQWALIGTVPERRPLLRATYGMLTLRNGVPIGYVGVDTLFRCADLSYNVFPTFRGGEAAYVFARMLGALGPIFGPQSFTIEPYQLGDHNEEGIVSGAWWFYYRLGFRPRNRKILQLARNELQRLKAKPRYRSSAATLLRLAQDYLYFETPGARAPYWPRLADLGKLIATKLAAHDGADRDGALDACLDRIHPALHDAMPRHAPASVNTAWRQWSAVLSILPGINRWTAAELKDLARVISAKGGRRDSDYLLLFDRHPKLGRALRELTGA